MNQYLELNLVEIAYTAIKTMISEGTLIPGSKINKRIVAEKLDISQTPVTEALKRLLGENFITYKNRFGYFVKQYTNEELADFFELRAALESLAVLLLIQRNKKGLEVTSITEFWENYRHQTIEEYVLFDNEFHEEIVLLSGNKALINAWFNSGYDVKSNQNGLQNTVEESQLDHIKLIAAIKAQDEYKAQLLMTEHFLRAANNIRMLNQPEE